MQDMEINQGVKLSRETENALLVDVRTEAEYAAGHIPGSINFPLNRIPLFPQEYADTGMTLCLYCQSGGRSGRAARFLESQGYETVYNLGGIGGYSGDLEK